MNEETRGYALDLGERICRAREALGLTQRQLAERLNVTEQYVSLLETGRRTARLEKYYAIAHITGVPFYTLFMPLTETIPPETMLFTGDLTEKERKALTVILNGGRSALRILREKS
jgi:transcriptional regulator with XRE-family HTH domain